MLQLATAQLICRHAAAHERAWSRVCVSMPAEHGVQRGGMMGLPSRRGQGLSQQHAPAWYWAFKLCSKAHDTACPHVGSSHASRPAWHGNGTLIWPTFARRGPTSSRIRAVHLCLRGRAEKKGVGTASQIRSCSSDLPLAAPTPLLGPARPSAGTDELIRTAPAMERLKAQPSAWRPSQVFDWRCRLLQTSADHPSGPPVRHGAPPDGCAARQGPSDPPSAGRRAQEGLDSPSSP